MAVPTLASVSPTTGSSQGGDLITLTGTGFPLPAVPGGIPTPDVYPSVRVTVGGEPAEVVEVRAGTSIVIRTPPYRGTVRSTGGAPTTLNQFPAVSVSIQNLDTSLNPIVGETVTLVGCFTYGRRDLGPPRRRGVYNKIVDALLETLRREVCTEVAIGRHSEYAEGGETQIELAKIPAMGLHLKFERDDDWAQFEAGREEYQDLGDATLVNQYGGLRARRLRVVAFLAARNDVECLELCETLEDWIEREGTLRVAADDRLVSGTAWDEYMVHIVDPPTLNQSGWDMDLVTGRCTFMVRGIIVTADLPDSRAKKIGSFEIETVDMDDNSTGGWTF